MNEGNIQFAGEVCARVLTEDPNNVEALLLMTRTLIDGGKTPLALCVAERARALAPTDHRAWLMVGACENSLQRPIGLKALEHALELSPNNPAVLRTLAHAAVINYRFEEAETYARQAIAREEHPQGHAALAFALLHRREWGEGWDQYAYGMGHQQWRDVQDYGLKDWNGEAGKVLVYAEQGLGDQLAYCSTTLEANVSEVVCHPKLKNLLERSLPCAVYGDQFVKEIHWRPEAEYQVSMSGLQRFYRRTPESFPKTPYLVPHPYKQFEVRALLRALGKRKKVGIAWTGGALNSAGYASRNLTLEQMRPFFDVDADFICLEYKDRTDEIEAFKDKHGIMLHDWPWRTQTEDYDDTAALISCLDAIVTVPTTCYHLAGALGVPALVLVHDTPYFHEGLSGECPWWGSVEFFRRRGPFINKAADRLSELCEFS